MSNSSSTSLDKFLYNPLKIVETCLILGMWLVALLASIYNFGVWSGLVFVALNTILVFRNPSYGIIVYYMLFFVPIVTLNIPRVFVVNSVIILAAQFVRLKQTSIKQICSPIFFFAVAYFIFMGLLLSTKNFENLAYVYYAKLFEGLVILFMVLYSVNYYDDLMSILKWFVILAALSLIVATIHFFLKEHSYLFQLNRYFNPLAVRKLFVESMGQGNYANRLLWFGKWPNGHACNLIFGFGVGMSFYIATKKKSWLILSTMIAVAILGTFSRSGMVTLLFVICTYVIVGRLFNPFFIITFASAVALVVFIIPSLFFRMTTISHNLTDEGASGRFYLWGQSFRMWLESPIWGQGLRSFVERNGYAAHNTFLEIMVDGGVIALLFYVLVIYFAVKSCIKVVASCGDDSDSGLFAKCCAIAMIGKCIMMFTITMAAVKLLWLECALLSTFIMILNRHNYSDAMGVK